MSDLFTYAAEAHARRSDPPTSHEAARAHEGAHARHCAAILSVLRAHGPLAAEQIASIGVERDDWPPELDKVACNKRFADLISAGLIVRTTLRHLNANGRSALKVRVA